MLQSSAAAADRVMAAMSVYDRSISAAKVILTGFVVVFAVLFLLIVIIKVYSATIKGVQDAADRRSKRKERVMEPVSGEGGVHIIKRPAYVTPPTVEEDIPEEVIAVIAAAVAATISPSATVRSIKKSVSGRSAWAHAGVLDNTRPF